MLVPTIGVSFVEATLIDLAIALGDPKTHQPLKPLWKYVNLLAIPTVLLVTALCTLAWDLGIERRRSAAPSSRIARRIRTIPPYSTFVVIVCVIARSIEALPVTNTSAHLSPGEAGLWVLLFAIVLLIQRVTLSFQQGVESRNRTAKNAT